MPYFIYVLDTDADVNKPANHAARIHVAAAAAGPPAAPKFAFEAVVANRAERTVAGNRDLCPYIGPDTVAVGTIVVVAAAASSSAVAVCAASNRNRCPNPVSIHCAVS